MKKILNILLVIAVFFSYIGISNISIFAATTRSNKIYITNNGNDSNNGTVTSPVNSLEKAFQLVNNNGKIVVQNLVTIQEAFLTPRNKNVIITEIGNNSNNMGEIRFRHNFVIQSNITFENIKIGQSTSTDHIKNNRIVANGYTLTMGN